MIAADQRVLMAALSVALRAQVDDLELGAVRALQHQAEAHLPEGDAMRGAIARFVAAHAEARWDPAALAEIGADLRRAVELRRDAGARGPGEG